MPERHSWHLHQLCHAPADTEGLHPVPANRLGFRHIAVQANGIITIVDGLRDKGFETAGEVRDFEAPERLRYVRGPEGLFDERDEQIASEGAS